MSGVDPFAKYYQGGDPDDIRFQFDVIKHLSESVRNLATGIADMQKTQVGMLERLAVLEAGKFAEDISGLELKVNALMRDKDQRDGAAGAFRLIKDWAPFLAMLFSAACALWLYGRSAGVVPAPPTQQQHREAQEVPNVH